MLGRGPPPHRRYSVARWVLTAGVTLFTTTTRYTKDVKEAAAALGVSNSQLLKFLKQEPRAFQLVNGVRASQGFKPLT